MAIFTIQALINLLIRLVAGYRPKWITLPLRFLIIMFADSRLDLLNNKWYLWVTYFQVPTDKKADGSRKFNLDWKLLSTEYRQRLPDALSPITAQFVWRTPLQTQAKCYVNLALSAIAAACKSSSESIITMSVWMRLAGVFLYSAHWVRIAYSEQYSAAITTQ